MCAKIQYDETLKLKCSDHFCRKSLKFGPEKCFIRYQISLASYKYALVKEHALMKLCTSKHIIFTNIHHENLLIIKELSSVNINCENKF